MKEEKNGVETIIIGSCGAGICGITQQLINHIDKAGFRVIRDEDEIKPLCLNDLKFQLRTLRDPPEFKQPKRHHIKRRKGYF